MQHSPGTSSARWARLQNALLAASCGGLIAACGGDAGGGANPDTGPSSGGGKDAATQDGGSGAQDGGSGGEERDGATAGSDDAAAAGGSDGGSSTQDAGPTRDGGSSSEAGCLAATLLDSLGIGHTLVGGSMDDDSAQAAPFDARYLYLAGGLFDGDRACTSCASGCSSGGVSCANSGEGCAWWGCWQYDQDPPGAYVRDFVARAKADKQLPMISYYELLQASGLDEGEEQVKALNDAGLMRRYLADFAFVLDQIGSERAIVHIEPDLWAYAQQVNQNPASSPARVASAHDQCKSYENNVAGLGRCMVHLVRVHAPNARVGFHGSGWATGMDALSNGDPGLDVAGEARKLATFLNAIGAADTDFVAVDASDRDAAWYDTQGRDTWWDATNKTLPNFKQAFTWAKSLAEALKKPVLWWQVPVGNMQLPNQQNRWKDNRLDYFLDHPDEVAASHGAGMLFGAGDGNQTTPDTDSGHLIARMKSYAAKPQRVCP